MSQPSNVFHAFKQRYYSARSLQCGSITVMSNAIIPYNKQKRETKQTVKRRHGSTDATRESLMVVTSKPRARPISLQYL